MSCHTTNTCNIHCGVTPWSAPESDSDNDSDSDSDSDSDGYCDESDKSV